MKKRLARLLAATLLALLLPSAGCTKEPVQTDSPTLMVYMNLGTPEQEDFEAVAAALDAYAVEKLGVHVQLLPSLQSTYSYRQELKQRLYSGEQIDIAYCPSISDVFLLAGNGSLHPLDTLLQEYGSGVSALLEPEYYEFSRVDGKLYAMPAKRDLYQTSGFEYDKEIADRYGLDLSGVQTLSDLTAVFAELKQKAPEIIPAVIIPYILQFDRVDMLGDGYGILTAESGTTVVNLYQTEQFRELVTRIHQWQDAGYLCDYVGNAGYSTYYYLSSGTVFGCFSKGKLGIEEQESRLCGREIGFVPFSPNYRSTDSPIWAWYTIPSTSAYPEKAMELLEMFYTDPYVADLLLYGIENVNYTRASDGTIDYVNADPATAYAGPSGWTYCNQFIASTWRGSDPQLGEKTEALNRTALRSPAWGFVFDQTPVLAQISRCEQVKSEYLDALYAGVADPEATLQAFCAALDEAGIQDILAEKQRQLDAFLLSQR